MYNSDSKIEKATVLTVDDNPSFLDILEILLKDMGISHIYKANSYDKAVEILDNMDIDLCILDIDLGPSNKSGIDIAEHIRQDDSIMPIIILTSNYSEHFYHQAKSVLPSCFMNKELSYLTLYQAIELAMIQSNNQKELSTDKGNELSTLIPFLSKKNIFIKIGDSYKGLKTENIQFFFTKDKVTYAKFENRNFPTNLLLKDLELELSPQFIRIHKSFLVNTEHISAIDPKDQKVQIGNESLPIGYAFKKQLFNHLNLIK